jgi:hypothetical protein
MRAFALGQAPDHLGRAGQGDETEDQKQQDWRADEKDE